MKVYTPPIFSPGVKPGRKELWPDCLKKRGPIKKKITAEAKEIARLEREVVKLKEQLRRAAVINDVQKKVSDILGIDLNQPESEEND